MKTMLSSRYVDALVKTIFLFGMVHVAIVAYVALHGDLEALNAFAILHLHRLFPSLGQGALNFLLSYGMVLGVYCGVWWWLAHRRRER